MRISDSIALEAAAVLRSARSVAPVPPAKLTYAIKPGGLVDAVAMEASPPIDVPTGRCDRDRPTSDGAPIRSLRAPTMRRPPLRDRSWEPQSVAEHVEPHGRVFEIVPPVCAIPGRIGATTAKPFEQ